MCKAIRNNTWCWTTISDFIFVMNQDFKVPMILLCSSHNSIRFMTTFMILLKSLSFFLIECKCVPVVHNQTRYCFYCRASLCFWLTHPPSVSVVGGALFFFFFLHILKTLYVCLWEGLSFFIPSAIFLKRLGVIRNYCACLSEQKRSDRNKNARCRSFFDFSIHQCRNSYWT